MKDDNGEWFEDLDNITRTATQFFEHIYSTSHPTSKVVLEPRSYWYNRLWLMWWMRLYQLSSHRMKSWCRSADVPSKDSPYDMPHPPILPKFFGLLVCLDVAWWLLKKIQTTIFTFYFRGYFTLMSIIFVDRPWIELTEILLLAKNLYLGLHYFHCNKFLAPLLGNALWTPRFNFCYFQ